MKKRLQFNSTLPLALLCSLGWFALFVFAFEPAEAPQPVWTSIPLIQRIQPIDPMLSELQKPTLFAQPSEEGFSGIFPEKTLQRPLSFKPARRQTAYLSRRPAPAPLPDQGNLIQRVSLPQNELPAPDYESTTVLRTPRETDLFFSPTLLPRIPQSFAFEPPKTSAALSIRVHLTVRPDGTIAHVFLDSATDQPTLLSAIRKIRLAPAPETTEGWMDLRITPTSGEKK